VWRAVFTENGQRKFQQGATEEKLAAKLEKVKERPQAGAENMERPGADLLSAAAIEGGVRPEEHQTR